MATLRRSRRDGRTGGGVAAGARGALAILARIIILIVTVVTVIIVGGILLVVLKANTGNSIVSTIHDAAKTLVGPFKDVFSIKDKKLNTAVNWGLAAVVYNVVAHLIAGLLRR